MLTLSCNKTGSEITPDNPVDVNPAGEQITISAKLSEAITKVAFTPDADGSGKAILKLAWESGDKLVVADHANPSSTAEFDLQSGDGTAEATFTGTLPAGASSYDVSIKSSGTVDYNTIQQAADNDVSHLEYIAAKKGLTDLTSVVFDEVCGVLGITAKLPAGVAANVRSISIVASENIFNSGNTLSIALDSPGDEGNDDILRLYAPLPATSQGISAGTTLLIRFNDRYTRFITLGAATLTPGKLNEIKVNCSATDKHAGAPSCDGSNDEKAYLIGDKYQLLAMNSLMVDNATRYFKLIDNIDMKDESWVALNAPEPYNKGIDFDGNNKTISNLTVSSGSYPSFIGVLNGSIKDVVFEGATITAGENCAGVLAGYIGSSSAGVSGTCSGITVNNSTVTGSRNGLGGLAGIVSKLSSAISDCHVNNTSVISTKERVGGLAGQVEQNLEVNNCSTDGVVVEGSINIGALAGVLYGKAVNCISAGGSVKSTNTTSNVDIGLGGLVGYLDKGGLISKCSSSVNIKHTTNGRDIGGLVGKMLSATIEKSFATGNISGIQRNVGGLVGLVTLTSGKAVIRDCYCTGDVAGDAYSGGFLGLHEKGSVEISNCYSTSKVSGKFAMGGLIGVIGSADLSMSNCAAWNGTINASSHGSSNWSSAAVAGVTFPTCTLTDNYRNPSMFLTAYWVPAADYAHANVSSAHPLVTQAGTETTATSTASGQPGYPQFPYHGKVEAGKTLSQLASTTLGWDSSVWDFSEDLPKLK